MDKTFFDDFNNNCEDHRDCETDTKIIVEAQFVQEVKFAINFNLKREDVKRWYVIWDKLYVEFKNGKIKVFDADEADDSPQKFPNIVNVFSNVDQESEEEDCVENFDD